MHKDRTSTALMLWVGGTPGVKYCMVYMKYTVVSKTDRSLLLIVENKRKDPTKTSHVASSVSKILTCFRRCALDSGKHLGAGSASPSWRSSLF